MATVAESVTKDRSAFQTRAPATGKRRSPIVILRVGGTTSVDVDAERSRLLESLSVVWLGGGVVVMALDLRPTGRANSTPGCRAIE